jgi:RHS repeat-associated protein
VLVSYGYDTDSRVTSIGYGTGGSCSSPPTNLGTLTYGYDAGGRRTSSGGSLAAVTLPSAVTSSTTAYNADNEQTKFGSASSLTYNADGELSGDATNTYTWDARGHLSTISGGATASFVYDAFGRRMKRTIGSSTVTQFVYDRLNPVQELNSSNGVTANLLTGLNIDEYFTRTASGTTSTLLADALGSTIGLVGSAGSIATSYTYQPFGAATTGGAANTNPYQFTGRENDGTGLYFYRARYYSPTFQRFIGQDPIDFRGGDPNLYGYVWEDPTNWLDPDGLWGIGLIGTASAEGGLGVLGGAASAGAGGGVFWGGSPGINVGGFVSAGGFVGGPGLGPSYPAGNCRNLAAGAYAGISGGVFFTNANSANDLRGPFYGLNLDLGILSIQLAWSGGTVIGSVTAGPGEIGGASGYQTNTWAGTLAAQH